MKKLLIKFPPIKIPAKKSVLFASILLLLLRFNNNYGQAKEKNEDSITVAARLLGLEFTKPERDSLREGVAAGLRDYQSIRKYDLGNEVPPALWFNPVPSGMQFDHIQQTITWDLPRKVKRPKSDAELAFMNVGELSVLIQSKQISSLELTKLYLDRLKRFGDTLVIL